MPSHIDLIKHKKCSKKSVNSEIKHQNDTRSQNYRVIVEIHCDKSMHPCLRFVILISS